MQANLPDVYCPVHLSFGQEGVCDALHKCLRSDDWLFVSHRSHGHYLAKGGTEQKLWDEIMGLPTGVNGGFSGSQEMVDTSINFHASSIVGGLIGVATGVALALKLDEYYTDAIVACVFGDAAAEQGVLWESLNFAALHNLPIAFICENNGLSVQSEIKERQAMPISSRVMAFGLTSHLTVQEAVRSARLGVPSFCEMKITRECAHINLKTMTELV